MNSSIALALEIRKKCLELSFQKKSSHLGGSLSITDILAVLYTNVLRFDPKNPELIERDRLYYSKGHACMALYSVLEQKGFFSGLIDKFTKDGEYFTSHVNHKVPGVEFSTGSLGHALAVATGSALAAIKKGHNWRSVCIVSDGELNEGSNWESILLAPHLNLKNLILIVDYNKIQSFGFTKDVLDLDPLGEKFKAFNWNVFEVDGHDHTKIQDVFKKIDQNTNLKPSVIIAHTIKGKGISFMENKLEWHYRSPNEAEYKLGLKELGI
jgi:transketolase